MPGPTGQHTHILHQERATKKVTGVDWLDPQARPPGSTTGLDHRARPSEGDPGQGGCQGRPPLTRGLDWPTAEYPPLIGGI
jgi:hypothetical protein